MTISFRLVEGVDTGGYLGMWAPIWDQGTSIRKLDDHRYRFAAFSSFQVESSKGRLTFFRRALAPAMASGGEIRCPALYAVCTTKHFEVILTADCKMVDRFGTGINEIDRRRSQPAVPIPHH